MAQKAFTVSMGHRGCSRGGRTVGRTCDNVALRMLQDGELLSHRLAAAHSPLGWECDPQTGKSFSDEASTVSLSAVVHDVE